MTTFLFYFFLFSLPGLCSRPHWESFSVLSDPLAGLCGSNFLKEGRGKKEKEKEGEENEIWWQRF